MGFVDSSILMVCAEERDDITRADSDKFDSIFHQVQTMHDSGIFFFLNVRCSFCFCLLKVVNFVSLLIV